LRSPTPIPQHTFHSEFAAFNLFLSPRGAFRRRDSAPQGFLGSRKFITTVPTRQLSRSLNPRLGRSPTLAETPAHRLDTLRRRPDALRNAPVLQRCLIYWLLSSVLFFCGSSRTPIWEMWSRLCPAAGNSSRLVARLQLRAHQRLCLPFRSPLRIAGALSSGHTGLDRHDWQQWIWKEEVVSAIQIPTAHSGSSVVRPHGA